MTSVVHIQDLSIGYRTKNEEKIVAQNLTAELFSGELTCLLGANGVGKSTLLRTLVKQQAPLSGIIRLNNKDISEFSIQELSQQIAIVLTEKIQSPDLTVGELVAMGRSPYTGFWGKLKNEDKKRTEEALRQVNIHEMANRKILTLSDGERQKAMIAKALAQDTPIILLDEPTAFLDFPSKVEILQLLRRVSREMQKIVFLSTHDVDFALQLADRLWLMDLDGKIHTGTPQKLIESGFLENFFQSSQIVFDRTTKHFMIQ